MQLPRREDWDSQLVDVHGLWCAWCVEYLDGEVEKHHMLGQFWTRLNEPLDLQSPSRHLLEWTVLVHKRCHRPRASRHTGPSLQNLTDTVTTNIRELDPDVPERLLASDSDREDHLATLDSLAREAHDAGLYQLAALFKRFRRRARLQLDNSQRLGIVEDEIATLAGVRLRRPVAVRGLSFHGRPRLAYQFANFYSNRGAPALARQLIEAGDDEMTKLPPTARGEYAVDKLLRHAQVDRNAAAGHAARVETTIEYREHTALAITEFIDLGEHKYGSALASAQALLSSVKNVSWLYRAEACFTEALGLLATHKQLVGRQKALRGAYRYLVESQYIYVVLGLQSPPHPEVRRLLGLRTAVPASSEWVTSPASVLLEHGWFAHGQLSAGEALDLRREAIIESGLRDQVMSSLLALSAPPRARGVLWMPGGPPSRPWIRH